MITAHAYEDLGHAQYDWLDTRHHFSFAHYHDPKKMGFGALRVINDDRIKAGAGFEPHPHRDMEIITYVRQGAITHQDNQGNQGRTVAGDVQVMSAGTGIYHSEYNLEDEETRIFQIWIEPNQRGVQPRWDTHAFPNEPVTDALPLLVSGDGAAPLTIHQDARIYGGKLNAGTALTHQMDGPTYLVVSQGEVTVNGEVLKEGDGAEITDAKAVEITARTEAELLAIEVPLPNSSHK